MQSNEEPIALYIQQIWDAQNNKNKKDVKEVKEVKKVKTIKVVKEFEIEIVKPIVKRISKIDDNLANVQAMLEAELANCTDSTDITDFEPDFKMLQDELINFGTELGEEIAKNGPNEIFKQDDNTTRFL